MLELSKRQKELLWVVVQQYIDSANPVGSETIVEQCPDLECSSATIRKELSFLEENGFLTHPHTSAGRIPTDQGYRFYVDNLMKVYRMTMREKTLMDELQNMIKHDMGSIMEETAKTLQSVANYTAMIGTSTDLLPYVTGMVQNNFSAARRESVYLSGMAKMLYEPEFEDVNSIRKLTGLLEQKEQLMRLLDEYSKPQDVNIVIGEEIKEDGLHDYALVTKQINFKGKHLGCLGVLGPTRMKYSKVTSAINSIAEILDDFFEHIRM